MKYMFSFILLTLWGCGSKTEIKTIGTIERLDPALDDIISSDAIPEIIAEGFNWSEGPLWIEEQQMLIFSDVPENTVYKWSEAAGTEVYLKPSGYTGELQADSLVQGSNGLARGLDGKLVLCQHGDRRISFMDASLENPKPTFVPIADNYLGKRLNSPNDLVFNSHGDLFFTDPPYGLRLDINPGLQEIPFSGVYKVSDNKISLLTDTITRPNGIALMPDERTLIVANSDPNKAQWYAFDLLENDSLGNARIFFDGREMAKLDKGNPDGLKIDNNGNVFATGPGGVWIFDKTGKPLGRIKTTSLASNCCLSRDQKTLYITADMYVLRVILRP